MRRCARSAPAAGVTERLGRQLRADGAVIDVIFYWRALEFCARPAQLVTFLDVTEKRRAERRLEHLARHDGLTDLPNRASFRKSLDAAIARRTPDEGDLGVFYLDLDQFKAVIDTLGHATRRCAAARRRGAAARGAARHRCRRPLRRRRIRRAAARPERPG